MLFHALLQEQLIHDRQAELAELERRAASPGEALGKNPWLVESVRALLPALTHRLLGIPAPARPAGCGC